MPNTSLFATGTELTHLHRLVTRIAAAGAGTSVLILVALGFLTGEAHFFAEAVGPAIVTVALSVLIMVGREHAAIVFGMATLSVMIAHTFVGTAATTVAAATAIVVMGCMSVLFISKHVLAFISTGALLTLLAPVMWTGQLQGAFSTGLVMSLSFVVGSIAFFLVRNAAASVNARYRTVFHHAPVALVEIDWERSLAIVEEMEPSSADHLRVLLTNDETLLRSVVTRAVVVRANQAAARLMGVPGSQSLMGNVSGRFMEGELAPLWVEQVVTVWGPNSEAEYEIHVTTGGRERWLSVTTVAASDASRSVVALTDITASRLLEQSLNEVIQSKDEFIASVSHELRTPLTAVVGLASELTTSTQLGDRERADLLKILVDQSVEMSHIVEDLLVAARADTGTITVRVEEVDVAAEMRELAAQLDPTVDVSGVSRDVLASADRVRVRQILRNLLVNAVRYGGERRRVVVEGRDGFVAVEMRDSGLPLGPDERVRIFQPYERAHEEAGVTAAVGLGLSVSRQLAELMGGSLSYDHDGEAVFRLSLPSLRSAVHAEGAESVAS